MVTTAAPDAVEGQGAPAAPNLELDALEREAHALEGAADMAARPGPPAATTTAAELGEALSLIRALARPAFADWPAYGVEAWTDKQLDAISSAGGAIMDRHGWTMGELFAQWGPYIALIGATAPPALLTWQHLRTRKAIAEARARQRPPGAPPEDADGVRP